MKISEQNDTNLVNYCYQIIKNNIINNIFSAGKKLKINELKQLLKCGQSPIREALSRLATSGLVDTQDNKGFRVASISESNARDIYQTFLEIELLALTQAIHNGNDVWKSSIVASLYNLSLIENSIQKTSVNIWNERNYAFHYALIAGCNSPTLLDIRAILYNKFDRYCQLSFSLRQYTLEHNHQQHTELAKAVLDRNIKQAHTLMTQHIMGSLEDVIFLLKNHF